MKGPKPLDVSREELEALRERAQSGELRPEDAPLVEALAQTVVELSQAVEKKGTSLRRLLRIIFGSKNEKKSKLLGSDGDPEDPRPPGGGSGPGASTNASGKKKKARGHGRNGADRYTGAERVAIHHTDPALKAGGKCPDCGKGKLYKQKPAPVVHLRAQTPVTATVYECERLRCGGCGKVFTASAPAKAAERKYAGNVGVMIALLKYGAGMPFTRLESLHRAAGIPLPASVQWEQVAQTADVLWPVLEALWREAAAGDLVHNDDTTMKVLDLKKELDRLEAADEQSASAEKPRRGIFTSGLVSVAGRLRIGLFRTGNRHAGENLGDLLGRRSWEKPEAILMCDALSRNLPKEFKVLLANCLAHARRQFVDEFDAFPESCTYVIERFAEVYKNDAQARERNMDAQARLAYHRQFSAPVMNELEQWSHTQLDDHLVEPNSGLGEAINYLLNHWDALTFFLEKPGVPLDNNVCERALKKAILHRKNAMFYKTERGARVGDLFMSLIHTCELNGINALHYLQTLIDHARHLAKAPERWLPWNYHQAVEAMTSP